MDRVCTEEFSYSGVGSGECFFVEPPLTTANVCKFLHQIAVGLEAEFDRITLAVIDAYDFEIPSYRAISDQRLRDDVHITCEAIVSGWLKAMSIAGPMEVDTLRIVLEGVRRRVFQGIELSAVLRAFRVAMRVLWSEIVGSPVWYGQADKDLFFEVAAWSLDFADQISAAIAGAYTDQSGLIMAEVLKYKSTYLDAVLSGEVTAGLARPPVLESRHFVAVARLSPNLNLGYLEKLGEALRTKSQIALWTFRHRNIIAVLDWSGDVSRSRLLGDLERLVDEEHIEIFGVGGVAEGAIETRQSYVEAMTSLDLGPDVMPNKSGIYDFQDLAPISVMLEQPERARRFVRAVLEPLGELSKRSWVLPTLEAYLASAGSLKVVANFLQIHPNTLKYRLRELRNFTDAVFVEGDRARTLLLALRVRRALAIQARQCHGVWGDLMPDSKNADASGSRLAQSRPPFISDSTSAVDVDGLYHLGKSDLNLGTFTS